MIDPIRELNIRAKLLHHDVAARIAAATERLRALPELRRASGEEVMVFASKARRKHCLAAIAREAGFQGWDHATRVLGGDEHEADLGDLLCPRGASAFLNHWFATYEDARGAHAESGGYLLAYRKQCFVAGRDYVAVTLRLDPADEDWKSIAFDWIRPADPVARRRLYGKLLATRREPA